MRRDLIYTSIQRFPQWTATFCIPPRPPAIHRIRLQSGAIAQAERPLCHFREPHLFLLETSSFQSTSSDVGCGESRRIVVTTAGTR